MDRHVKKIVVHCSDSDDSLDIGAKDIDAWHKDRGWSGIGYHYVIRRDGRIETGRDLNKVGAHVKGHNKDSVGICWVGRKALSNQQITTLLGLLRGLLDKYDLDETAIYGHNEFDQNKTCPNFEMSWLIASLMFYFQGLNIDEL